MTPVDSSMLSITDWIVLGLVVEEPRHGFSAARELKADEALGQVWTVHRSLVYRSFDHLAALALIEPTYTEPGDQGPRRTVFRATRAGRRRVTLWLDQIVEHPRDTRTELLAKFVLLARRGQPLAPLARRQLEHFRPVTSGLERALDGAQGSDRLIALWRLKAVQSINVTLASIVDDATWDAPSSRRRPRH